MPYTVHIRNNETNEIREYVHPQQWYDQCAYMWEDGNYSCDCNRALFFERAIGADESEAWESRCGSGKFTILKVVLEDGEILNIDEDIL